MSLSSRLPRVALGLFVVALVGAAVSSRVAPARRGAPTLARLAAAVDDDCRAFRAPLRYRDASVCGSAKASSLPVVALRARAVLELQHVRERLADGDLTLARTMLRQVIRDADRIERNGRFLDALVASRTLGEALDVVEARPDVFDAAFVEDALRDVALGGGARAIRFDTIEVERGALSFVDGARPVVRPLLASVVPLTTAALDERRTEMAERTASGDVDGCKRAARTWVPAIGTVGPGYDQMLCERADELSKAKARVEQAKSRAALRVANLARPRR